MWRKRTIFCNVILAWLLSPAAHSQDQTSSRTQQVRFDSPEGWAMAHALSATLNLGHGPSTELAPMAYQFTGELASIPHIRREDTRVGFGGFKLEDLNKSPVFGRGTLRIGMPGNFAVAVSWTPPVSVDGAKPKNLFGLAFDKQLMHHNGWQLDARIYALTGDIQGDITCSREVAAHPPGSPANPFGCREKSRDTLKLDHHGAELLLSRALTERWQPYAALAVTQARPRTNVSARVFEILDEPELRTRGTLTTTTLGSRYQISDQWGVSGAISYTPLDVRRPSQSSSKSHDFWSARLSVSWYGL